MNFLAHVYLSGEDENIILGNFIADRIRPSQEHKFDKKLHLGMQLHRFIDDFTDKHELVAESRALLFENQSKYALVLTDIFYDHFLARDWKDWHSRELLPYTENFYRILEDNYAILPKRVKFMLPYMKKGNWLYNYQHLDGIDRVLQGMSHRANFKNNMAKGVEDLRKHYCELEAHFNQFFPELKQACEGFISDHS